MKRKEKRVQRGLRPFVFKARLDEKRRENNGGAQSSSGYCISIKTKSKYNNGIDFFWSGVEVHERSESGVVGIVDTVDGRSPRDRCAERDVHDRSRWCREAAD